MWLRGLHFCKKQLHAEKRMALSAKLEGSLPNFPDHFTQMAQCAAELQSLAAEEQSHFMYMLGAVYCGVCTISQLSQKISVGSCSCNIAGINVTVFPSTSAGRHSLIIAQARSCVKGALLEQYIYSLTAIFCSVYCNLFGKRRCIMQEAQVL